MKREYTIAWAAFALFIFCTEFLVGAGAQDGMRLLGLVMFLVIEGLAIGRRKTGDTLSEHVWAFYKGKKARIPLLVSWALYFAVAVTNIAVDPDLMVRGVPATILVIALGLLGWLLPHFLLRGKEG